MIYVLLSDGVVLVHFAFIAFVIFGGWLAARWRWVVWLHVPGVLWAIVVEAFNWGCPLTPLENTLRKWGGETGYEGDFVAHYVLPVLYAGVGSRGIQVAAAVIVVVVNMTAYAWMFARRSAANPP
jgi:hypothetical protein